MYLTSIALLVILSPKDRLLFVALAVACLGVAVLLELVEYE
jgi:hypothetical protein